MDIARPANRIALLAWSNGAPAAAALRGPRASAAPIPLDGFGRLVRRTSMWVSLSSMG
jgi:hypothetical protein